MDRSLTCVVVANGVVAIGSLYDAMRTGNPWLFSNPYANFMEKEEVENFDADFFGLKSKSIMRGKGRKE